MGKYLKQCKEHNEMKRLTTESFSKKVKDLTNNEYELKSKYINNKTYVKILHKKCNNIYEVKPNNFIYGKRCPYCAGVKKKTVKDIQEFLNKNYGKNKFIIKGNYINKDTPLEILHADCNNIITPTWNNIREGRFGCKYCNMSSGELKISNILTEENIDFEFQTCFNECKDEKCLPFDFCIEMNNEYYLIEYDGRQHFLPIFGYSNEERIKELDKCKKHDKIKNDFIKNFDNVHLLRISYKIKDEKEIRNLILNYLNKI